MALAQQSVDAWPDETAARPSPRFAAPGIPDADPATDMLEQACATISALRQRHLRLGRDACERQARFGAERAVADEAVSVWQRRTAVVAGQLDDSQARADELERIIEAATTRIERAEASLTGFERTACNGHAALHLYHDRIMTVFGTMDLG